MVGGRRTTDSDGVDTQVPKHTGVYYTNVTIITVVGLGRPQVPNTKNTKQMSNTVRIRTIKLIPPQRFLSR